MRTALAIALLASATVARADAPACETRVSVDPARAYVGQQVVYRLQILRRADVEAVRFVDALAFPSFRVEWLPGQTIDPAIRDVGEGRLVAEERRALFPVRAGTLEIPAARIECRTAKGASAAEVAASAVEAREPATPTPLVGRVAANAYLKPERIALGDSAQLTVTLRGVADLWDAAPPLAANAIAGVDVHPRAPRIERTPGPQLMLESSFVYDLVPRRAGTHVVPALRIPWLDPETGREESEVTGALLLEASAAAEAPREIAAEPPREPRRATRAPLWIGGLVLAATVLLSRARRGRAAPTPLRAAAPHLAAAIDAAARADREAEQRALAAALRAALAVRAPEVHSLAAEEVVAKTDGARREAALALADLDRARFAAAPHVTTRLHAERVRALVEAL